MATMQERVAERYPALLPLLRHGEIGPLLTRAVNENWSPGVFQSKFMATRWFRTQPESQRTWWVLQATDPGEAKLQRQNTSFALDAQARKVWGTVLNPAQLKWLTETALVRGLDPNSPEMLNAIRKVMKPGGGRGEIGALAAQIRAVGTGQWYVRPGQDSTYRVASQVILGQDTMESVNARFAAEAKQRYPHLAQRIDGGETLADITAGHRALVSEELETGDPEAVNIVNGEWRTLLGTRDPKTNEMRMMTDSEVIAQARNRDEYWQTSAGRANGAHQATNILQFMGQRA